MLPQINGALDPMSKGLQLDTFVHRVILLLIQGCCLSKGRCNLENNRIQRIKTVILEDQINLLDVWEMLYKSSQ